MYGERKQLCHERGEEATVLCVKRENSRAIFGKREPSGSVVRACVVWMLIDSPAAILLPAFGQKGTLAFWAFVVAVQYMMGSSMVRCSVSFCCGMLCCVKA